MYSTCLFCHADLGHNEALEHFTVGRRLAFDPATGRLWVVCRKCERWNLTPIETRWEAVEDAERAFRDTPLRVSTDNIGLARLREGTELVRIGRPPRLEFAAWRYGDQFGRRRTKYLAFGSVAFVAGLSPLMGVGARIFGLSLAASFAGSAISFTNSAYRIWKGRADSTRLSFVIPDEHGGAFGLTGSDARQLTIIPRGDADWQLKLHYHARRESSREALARHNAVKPVVVSRDVAMRALSMTLPFLNASGGSERRVREAVDVLGATPSLDVLLHDAATNPEGRKTHYKFKYGYVSTLPPRLRLALEMALHEGDERRALEGELQELEARWRDADAIARISDALLLPPGLDERMETLRARDASQE